MKKKVEQPRYSEEFSWSEEEEPEEEEMPEELVSYLGATHGSFHFIPSTLAAGYSELGVTMEETDILSPERLIDVATRLRLSLIQIEFEYDTPIPKSVQIVRVSGAPKQFMDYVISAKLPDGTIGFVSTQRKIVAIPLTELPKTITKEISKSRVLIKV
jgi:hypothetical protein